MNSNSDVYLGYVLASTSHQGSQVNQVDRWIGWSAGSFASNYELILTPQNGVDVPLMQQCFAKKFMPATARRSRKRRLSELIDGVEEVEQ